MSKINIGIAGKSMQIQRYLPYLMTNTNLNLVGSFDTSNSDNYQNFYGINPFNDFIKRTDAVLFIGEQQINFFENIEQCIRNSKHILVEKFPSFTIDQLYKLQKLITEASITFFVSNIQGTAPEYTSIMQHINKSRFIQIKCSKLQNNTQLQFNTPLFELIDMAIRSVNSRVSDVKLIKNQIFNANTDLYKFYISFENGTFAEVELNNACQQTNFSYTAYQKDRTLFIDFQQNKVIETINSKKIISESLFKEESVLEHEIVPISTEKKIIYYDIIQKDLLNFVDCISNHVSPIVGIDETIQVGLIMQQIQQGEYEMA